MRRSLREQPKASTSSACPCCAESPPDQPGLAPPAKRSKLAQPTPSPRATTKKTTKQSVTQPEAVMPHHPIHDVDTGTYAVIPPPAATPTRLRSATGSLPPQVDVPNLQTPAPLPPNRGFLRRVVK